MISPLPENPLPLIWERAALLGLDESERFRIWGGWCDDPPPMIGDPRLLKFARDAKPLFVFDSFIRFHQADENSASEMARVMSYLRELANAGASVLVQHHRPKSEGSKYRGSSDIHAGVDTAFAMSYDRESSLLKIQCFKNRLGQEFSFTVRPDLEHSGQFVLTDAPEVSTQREEIEKLAAVISESPGLPQGEVVRRSGLPQRRAMFLLKQNSKGLWRIKRAEKKNAVLFHPSTASVETVV